MARTSAFQASRHIDHTGSLAGIPGYWASRRSSETPLNQRITKPAGSRNRVRLPADGRVRHDSILRHSTCGSSLDRTNWAGRTVHAARRMVEGNRQSKQETRTGDFQRRQSRRQRPSAAQGSSQSNRGRPRSNYRRPSKDPRRGRTARPLVAEPQNLFHKIPEL